MKIIEFNDLKNHTNLFNLIKESTTKKLKTKKEVLREFNTEKWGSILFDLKTGEDKGLGYVDNLIENFKETKAFYKDNQFLLANGKEIFDSHIQLYMSTMRDYIKDSSCIVELGAGYGSKILNISQFAEFNHLPLYAAEYTENGCQCIKLLSKRMKKNIYVGKCDFKELTLDLIDIPEDSIIFTSYALHYAQTLSSEFIDFIRILKPRVVFHFEPVYEHHGNDEYGQMCQRYIEINDYNLNMASVFREKMKMNEINLMERENLLGGNPFLPLSVIKWSPAGINLNDMRVMS